MEKYGVRATSRWPHLRNDKILPFPLSHAYAAAILEKEGIEVKAIDAVDQELSIEEFVDKVKEFNPEYIFVDISFASYEYDKKTIKELKNKLPKLKIVVFGPDATARNEEIMNDLKEMGVKVYLSKKRPENGKKRDGYLKAKGDIIIFIDSDNEMVEKDWIKKMVKPLVSDESISYCISRIAVVKTDKLLNQYLSIIAPDPFVEYKSMDAYLALNKLSLKDEGEYETYTQNLKKFLITSGNYFASRKKTLEKIGGYTQDTEVAYKFFKTGLGKIGIPKDAHLHHHIASSLKEFTIKKFRWGKIYFLEQNKGREFNWIPEGFLGKLGVGARVLKNLLFFPEAFVGVYRAIIYKQKAWLIHPIAIWLNTAAYLYAYIYCIILKKN